MVQKDELTGDDIRAYREKVGWSQADLATLAGTSQQTVDRIERGETKHSRALPGIERAINRHRDGWLVGPPPTRREHIVAPQPQTYASPVPTLDNTYAVFSWTERDFRAVQFINPPPEMASRHGGYCIQVVNDIFAPDIKSGDILYVDPLAHPETGNFVVAFDSNEVLIGSLASIEPSEALIRLSSKGTTRRLSRRQWHLQKIQSRFTPLD